MEREQGEFVAELVSKRGHEFEVEQALVTHSLDTGQKFIAMGQIGPLNSNELESLAVELNGKEDAVHGAHGEANIELPNVLGNFSPRLVVEQEKSLESPVMALNIDQSVAIE